MKKSDQNKITLKLKRAPKIIDQIKKIQKNVFLVGFKAETNLPKNKLIDSTRRRMLESNADLMITNGIGSQKYKMNNEYNNVIIVDSKKQLNQDGRKNKRS